MPGNQGETKNKVVVCKRGVEANTGESKTSNGVKGGRHMQLKVQKFLRK